jgi:hypothetical protein
MIKFDLGPPFHGGQQCGWGGTVAQAHWMAIGVRGWRHYPGTNVEHGRPRDPSAKHGTPFGDDV